MRGPANDAGRDLAKPAVNEPTLKKMHLQCTSYDSTDAPVVIKFFPYKQSDVCHCSRCRRHLLRYTEFGGYNVDHRVLALAREYIID